MRAYEAALAELIREDPDDDLRFHSLMDKPPDEAERGTALWLAIEYSVLLDRIHGRTADLSDDELSGLCAELERCQQKIIARFHRADRVAELRAMPYRAYLRTPEWQARRRAALAAAGHHCQLCNAASDLDVHHRTYERRGDEADGDLTVLCRSCHAHFHEHRDLAR